MPRTGIAGTNTQPMGIRKFGRMRWGILKQKTGLGEDLQEPPDFPEISVHPAQRQTCRATPHMAPEQKRKLGKNFYNVCVKGCR